MMGSLLRSFRYAASGVAYCFRTQRNLRIHALAAVLALAAGFRLGLSGAELGVLALTIAAVLVAEMFNTAVEALVDIVSPGYHPLAKVAKDDNCCVYVKTIIQSQHKQDVVLGFGSDDGLKVWLNGKVINAKNLVRGVKCDEDQVKVALNEGDNALLLKVTQGGSDFAFCAGIKAPDGAPADGVHFEAR
jgi:diacylglycerol kinase